MAAAVTSRARFLEAAGYAAIFTIVMIWTMYLLIQGGRRAFDKLETLQTIDFVRLKKDTDLELRQRQKPPKPPPPKEPPPPPKLKVAATPQTPNAPTPFQLPNLNLSATVSGGPFLGGYMGGDLSGTSELIPLVRIAPQYPRNAARDRIEGYVVLQLIVNPDGTVKEARPVDAKPRGVFEAAAVNAILKWKFKPKILDGKPVEQRANQKLEFKLTD